VSAESRESEYRQLLVEMSDEELREEWARAGDAYEHFGGYWTLALVVAEVKRRGVAV
jgi:hypothetical protein